MLFMSRRGYCERLSQHAENREVDVSLTLLKTSADGLRLKSGAVAVPALTSHVRPALVLPELQARALLDAANHEDVLA